MEFPLAVCSGDKRLLYLIARGERGQLGWVERARPGPGEGQIGVLQSDVAMRMEVALR